MAASKFFVLLFLVVVVSSISSVYTTIHLHFYYYEAYDGIFQSSFIVANLNNTSGLGTIRVNDNPLRDGPDFTANVIGGEQGFTVDTSQDGKTLMTTQSFVFTAGAYSGSSIDVVERFNTTNTTYERSIIGGTGQFRFSCGYAVSKTLMVNPSLAHVENDLYIL